MDSTPVILHLGCGTKKEKGAFGVDCLALPGVDLVHNLEVTPLPLSNDRFEKVIAVDVLEHIDRMIPLVEEIYRVSKNGAEFLVVGPFATSMDRHTDPTHRRGFTRGSFDYFSEGTEAFDRYRYSTARFRKKAWGYCMNSPHTFFRRALVKFANRFPVLYERYFTYLFPMDYMYFSLEVVKK